MAPHSTLGSCARILVFPCSVRWINFLSTSPSVFAPRWHNMLRPLGSDVGRPRHFQDDIWWKIENILGAQFLLDETFVGLNNHQVWVALDESDCPALMQKEIMVDGEKLELKFQGLAKFLKASFECDWNVPIPRFPFWPNVYFRIGKKH